MTIDACPSTSCHRALCIAAVIALLTAGLPGAVAKDKGPPDDDVTSQLGGEATVAQGGQNGDLKNQAAANESASPNAPVDATKSQVQSTRPNQLYDPISPKILRGQVNGILVSDLVLKRPQTYANMTDFKGYNVDFHYEKKLLVYTAIGAIFKDEVVSRLLRSGNMPTRLVSANGPTRLAVDWLHDRLYWMNDATRTVEAVGLDGANRSTVVDSLPDFRYPNNLAVDPYKGYLFFVSNHSIYRSDLQGENLTRINPAFEGVRGVKCLTLDVPTKRLYFSGKSGNVVNGKPYVASCGYDGEGSQTYKLKGLWNDIFSLAVFKGTLYFAHFQDDRPDAVYSAQITSQPEVGVTPYNIFSAEQNDGILSITVYHPDKQKEKEDDY